MLSQDKIENIYAGIEKEITNTENVISIFDAKKILEGDYDDDMIKNYIDIITELSIFTIKDFYSKNQNIL